MAKNMTPKEMQSYLEMTQMPLQSMAQIGEGVTVIRVIGGWIYRFDAGISVCAVFVPEPKEEL